MELSFLGTRLFPVSCGGTLWVLVPRFGRLEACGMWLWEKVSRWMVFLRTGMRGDTPPGTFEGRGGHPSRWLWEEFPGPGAPCGCISKSWSIQVFHLPLRQSTERKGQVGVRRSRLEALFLLTSAPHPDQQVALPGLKGPCLGDCQILRRAHMSLTPVLPQLHLLRSYTHLTRTGTLSRTPTQVPPRWRRRMLQEWWRSVNRLLLAQGNSVGEEGVPLPLPGSECGPCVSEQLHGGRIYEFRDPREGRWLLEAYLALPLGSHPQQPK